MDKHFNATFAYVVGVSVWVLSYVGVVTFIPIPKDNARFVDIAFGFLLNIFAGAANYLLGGNPAPKKNEPDGGIILPPGDKTTITTEAKPE